MIFQLVVPEDGVLTCKSPPEVQLTVKFMVPAIAVPKFEMLVAFPFRAMIEKKVFELLLSKKPKIVELLGLPASTITKPLLFPVEKL